MPFVFRNLDDGVDFQFIYPGKTTIGRGENNHWSPPAQRAVSKMHAEVEISGSSEDRTFDSRIIDLESRNGTFIGTGNPIEWEKVRGMRKLSLGDKVKFGTGGTPYQFIYVNLDQALNLVPPRVVENAVPLIPTAVSGANKLATVEELIEFNGVVEEGSRSIISQDDDGSTQHAFLLYYYYYRQLTLCVNECQCLKRI
jgi:hypothetical protein